MLAETCLPPNLDAVARAVALFSTYTTLMKYNVSPFAHAAMLIILRAVVCTRMQGKDAPSCNKRPRPVIDCLHGCWAAVNITCLVVAIGKLHPFRVVVGQYAALLFQQGCPRRAATAVSFMLSGLMVLGWANNLTPTHLHRTSVHGEDAIHVLDSIGGMMALIFFCTSESLRTWLRYSGTTSSCVSKGPTNYRGQQHYLEHGAAVLFISAMAAFAGVFFAKGAGWATVATWGMSSAGDGLLAFAFPALASALLHHVREVDWGFTIGLQQIRRVSLRDVCVLPLSATSGTVFVSSVAGFLLHTVYHQHFLPSGDLIADEAFHPLLHLDNIMVLAGSGLVGFALHISRANAYSDGTLEHDSPFVLFDLTPSTSSTSVTQTFRVILSHRRQRKLFVFFLMTMTFMVVELLYGLHANSLSLVSDSFHMLLDAASIGLGLWTSVMASWSHNERYPHGYGGYESMSGFVNGMLLLLVAIRICWESLIRLWEPPEVATEYLLAVAVGGLLVNIIGVVFFHEAHSHHGHSHSSPHHGHSHHNGACEKGHHSHSDGAAHQNMRGIYLHILADLLGSVAVILSTVLIGLTGWTVVDPLCSILISCFIFMSALPLVQQAGASLAFGAEVPWQRDERFEAFSQAVSSVDGVVGLNDMHVQCHCGTPVFIAVSLRLASGTDCRRVKTECRHHAQHLYLLGVDSVVVEAL